MESKILLPKHIKPVNGNFDYNQVPRGHYENIIWHGHPIRAFWHKERFLEMQALMNTNADSALLDYGCASGSFLGHLTIPYKIAYGIDIAAPQIQLASEKYGSDKLKFIVGDHKNLDFEDGAFDYITNTEVIEHVTRQDGLEMLRVFHRLLKPNGRLLLSTPNYTSLWPVIELFVNKFSEVDYEHQHINKLGIRSCQKMLLESGFTIEKLQTIFVLSPFLAGLSYRGSQKIFQFEKALLPKMGSLILLSAKKNA